MNQYVVLEDSILAGFNYLSNDPGLNVDKEKLKKCASKCNEFGADFQDGWNQEYWNVYENIREGSKNVRFYQFKIVTKAGVSHKVSELQELAIAMNKNQNTSVTDKSSEIALKEVDELAIQYDKSTLLPNTERHTSIQFYPTCQKQ